MAQCIDCGVKLNFLNKREDGRCADCSIADAKRAFAEKHPVYEAEIRQQAERKDAEMEAISSILLTTETASNLKIVRRIEIVTAECAFGMNIFKDLFAGIRDIVGGRSEAVQQTMRDARKTALYELKREAYLVGANAVVGVDLDYTELGGAGSNMVMLVASGTAVVIEN